MEQADRIVAAVNKHRVPFTLAWQMRVDPQNLRMKQLVRDGTLGRVYMVRRRHGLSTHVWPGFETSWHVKPELNRGMWADDASHAIDFLYWLLGEPVSVSAEIGTLRSPQVPDDNGIAIYRYADGAFAEAACSFTCLAGENTTEIVGEKGVAIQNYGDAPSCNAPRTWAAGAAGVSGGASGGGPGLKWYLHETKQWAVAPEPSPDNHGRRIAALAEPLLEFLEGKRPPIATAAEGRAVLRMTLASYESAARGCRVPL
jgi:predicted dehydrogenase